MPRGESLLPGSHCPNCDAPIRPLQNVPVISRLVLHGKCANCGEPINARYPLIELGTGVAFALVTWWFVRAVGLPTGTSLAQVSWWLLLAAYLWFAAASIALALIDIDFQRLPNRIVLPSTVVVIVLLSLAAIVQLDLTRLVSTLGGAAAMFALYLVIMLVYPQGIGGGDVKLAPMIGAALGYVGWSELAAGAFAGFVLGALWAVALIARRAGSRKTGLPFGPFMLLGAWIGLVGAIYVIPVP